MECSEFGQRLLRGINQTSSNQEFAIVINSEYFMDSGKLIYVKVVTDRDNKPSLRFYNKTTDFKRYSVIEGALDNLESRLMNRTVLGVFLPENVSIRDTKIVISADMGLIIIESQMYNTVKKLVMENRSAATVSLSIGDITLTADQVNTMIRRFRDESFEKFYKLIYSKVANRFVSRLWRYNEMYSIQKAFIPVFIKYTHIYNPLFDDKDTASLMQNFEIYQLAVSKNRLIELRDLSCYMLTHYEICEAFGMSKFMRFTPQFFYKIFVGLLRSDLRFFPNKNTPAFLRDKTIGYSRFPMVLAEDKMTQHLIALESVLSKPNITEDERKDAESKLTELRAYSQITSLYGACVTDIEQLTSIGSSVLDSKENTRVNAIYSYIEEARLKS